MGRFNLLVIYIETFFTGFSKTGFFFCNDGYPPLTNNCMHSGAGSLLRDKLAQTHSDHSEPVQLRYGIRTLLLNHIWYGK